MPQIVVPPAAISTPSLSADQTWTGSQTYTGRLKVSSGYPWFDVTAFGADPSGAADSTSAIALAVAAVPAAGGVVYFPAGTYKANVSLASKTDVTLRGSGTGSIIKPASGTAISISGSTRCNVFDLQLSGAGGGAIGISISGDYDSVHRGLYISGFSGDGFYVQGDTLTEITLADVTCRANGGFGYHYVRTNANPSGGMYAINLRCIYDTTGTGGIRLENSFTSEVAVYNFFDGVYVEYTGVPGIRITDVAHVYFTQFWSACTNATGSAFLIDGSHTPNSIIMQGGHIENSSSAVGTTSLSINAGSDIIMSNLSFGGVAANHIHVGSTGANFMLYNYDLTGSSPLTDTPATLWHRSNFTTNTGPVQFVTEGTGGATSIGLEDPNHSGNQKWLRNFNGSFGVLSTDYAREIIRMDDGGFVVCYGGFMPYGSNTGACTLYSGSGAPGAGLGANGDFYFRSDGVGGNVRFYFKTGGAWVGLLGTESTLQTLAGSDTITTAGVTVARVTCTANRASVILAVGTFAGQEVTVVNEGSFTVTFAASATSHVADGVSDVIASLTARKFVWDTGTSLWYRAA